MVYASVFNPIEEAALELVAAGGLSLSEEAPEEVPDDWVVIVAETLCELDIGKDGNDTDVADNVAFDCLQNCWTRFSAVESSEVQPLATQLKYVNGNLALDLSFVSKDNKRGFKEGILLRTPAIYTDEIITVDIRNWSRQASVH